MMDFGYPQTTESKILQEYITQESHKLEVQARPPIAVTNAVSWRSEGIRYRKNEVFLDVVESLNLLVSSNGNVLRSEILGAIKMKCYLSGMPELRLGLNDKVMFETTGRATRGKAIEMEDVRFHQCVRLARFENDRTISFIPPDGEFELMSYRLNTAVKPLIWVECIVESHSGSRIEYMLKAKAQFKRRSTANNVEITVPVPEDADSPRFRTNIGSVHYAPEKSAIVWKIKQFGGNKEFLMRAELGLPSVKGDDEHGGGMTGGFGGSMGGVGGKGAKRPISVKFEIPYFTTSGIQVRYLKIIEPKVRCPHLAPFCCGDDHMTSSTWLRPCSMLVTQMLTFFYSFNIPLCHGYATSHNQATSPSDYQTSVLQTDPDEQVLSNYKKMSRETMLSWLGWEKALHFRRKRTGVRIQRFTIRRIRCQAKLAAKICPKFSR
jgi:AP-1 complex subunit mu